MSSFLACAPTEAEAAELAREPLLESLSTRMKTRVVSVRAIDGAGGHADPVRGRRGDCRRRRGRADRGMAAAAWRRRSAGIAAQGTESRRACTSTGPTRRCAAPRWPCRRACCGTCPPRPCTSASCRKVARARGAPRPCASCSTRAPRRNTAHGLEMRTELAIGETVTEITRNLSAGTAQMLVLGITDITQAGTAYRSLLAAQPGWPVLIVYRPSGHGARVARDSRLKMAAGMKNVGQREPNVIPGFGITLGFTTFFLCAIVLHAAVGAGAQGGGHGLGRASSSVITSPRALASYRAVVRRVAGRRRHEHGVRLRASPGRWCATTSRAARSSTPSSTCRSRCPPRCPASR